MEMQMNWLAILVAVVANFMLGFLWYTPLFGKAWAKELGMDMSQKPDPKVMLKGLSFNVIGNFLLAYVLSHNIIAWSYVPGMDDMSKMTTVFTTAIFTWLGFYVPYHLGAIVWEKRSWKLFFINTGYALASLLLVAGVIIFMN